MKKIEIHLFKKTLHTYIKLDFHLNIIPMQNAVNNRGCFTNHPLCYRRIVLVNLGPNHLLQNCSKIDPLLIIERLDHQVQFLCT